MRTFLGVCLLIGLAAVLIPSVSGLQCVICKTFHSCENYTSTGNTSFHETCGSNLTDENEKPMCTRRTSQNSEMERGCNITKGGIPECWFKGSYKVCQCDGDLSNDSYLSMEKCIQNYTNAHPTSPEPETKDPSSGGSAQQLGQKGPCFGIMGIVLLLGGVGGQFFRG